MNFYTVGIEGMTRMLDDFESPLNNFKKKEYAGAFKKFYESKLVTMQAIENGYQQVVDKEQFLDNMAIALCDFAKERVDGAGKKANQEKVLLDFNLCMAVYVLPSILKFQGESSGILVEMLLKEWKVRFPKTSIQAATYEHIEGGFHRKFCYITTAVCTTFGKPDDCYELTLLRNYRDGYLMQQPEGVDIIKEYYDVAPTIVKHINKDPNKLQIYRNIWDEYLAPCICFIENGEDEECKVLYMRMVKELQEDYFLMNTKKAEEKLA